MSDEATMLLQMPDEAMLARRRAAARPPAPPGPAPAPPRSPAEHARAQPYPFDRLPAWTGDQVALLDRALALCAPGGQPVTLTIEGALAGLLGVPAQVRFHGAVVHRMASLSRELGHTLITQIWCAPEPRGGALLCDLSLVEAALDALLGEPPGQHPRVHPIGPRDFGLATYVMLRAWDQLVSEHHAPSLTFATEIPALAEVFATLERGLHVVEITWEVSLGARRGLVRLLATEALLQQLETHRPEAAPAIAQVADGPLAAAACRYPVVLGTAALTPHEAATLEVGDVILLATHGVCMDGITAAGHSALLLHPRVHGDAPRAAAQLGWQAGRWQITLITPDKETPMTPAEDAAVDLSAIIGQARITLGQLATLQPGQILTLDQDVGATVELRVDGALLGTAELVNVDGRLGVRLLSVRR